jgi:ankyrin repeat protein
MNSQALTIGSLFIALHIAAKDNNIDAAKLLLLNGANVNATDIYVSTSVC